MKRQELNLGWQFRMQGESTFPAAEPVWEAVDLPHDFSISQDRDPMASGGHSVGYYPGGVGVYRRELDIPVEWEGKTVLVEFEGVYMNADVSINGNLAAKHPYGYTSFHADLTDYLRCGKVNTLEVTVKNSAQPNSRWYSGSGIYRSVHLLVADACHISPWGLFITTPSVSNEAAEVQAEVEVENRSCKPRHASARIRLTDPDGKTAAEMQTPVFVPANVSVKATMRIPLKQPSRWSCETPDLYRAEAALLCGEEEIDTAAVSFGVRSLSWNAREGLLLNGEPVKLRGGCIHHDNGVLGACAFTAAEERRVRLHKEAGFNAIRSAHNPPSPALLDACDRYGILVMDETFDCWRAGKNPYDYNLYFEDWWQRDTASMVLRDRNHPCVFAYSIGNEIGERDGSSDGAAWALRQADFVRSLDPTRPVASALCMVDGDTPREEIERRGKELAAHGEGRMYNTTDVFIRGAASLESWEDATEPYASALDIVGYNYMANKYEPDGEKYPGRIIAGTETFPMDIDINWALVKKLPYVIGDFTWTSWDYIGESGIGKHTYDFGGEPDGAMGTYPWHIAFDADFDICGFRRPQSYYREIVWGLRNDPYIAVADPARFGQPVSISPWGYHDVWESWNWPGFEGNPIRVDVYTDAEEVELFQDGKSVGRKKAERFTASFELAYTPGRLEAVSYTGGKETGRHSLESAGKAVALALAVERADLATDGKDLAFITVNVSDSEGRRVPSACADVSVAVTGAGTLAGLGTGDPVSLENYTASHFHTYEGRILAVVRAGTDPGTVHVQAQADGLQTAAAELIVR